MKNAAPENGLAEAPATKRSKLDPEVAEPVNESVEEIEKIQEELHQLDEQCAKEQMQIQKKFDEKKKPFFDKRQTLIERIPNFWAEAFGHHPALLGITEHDRPILECLKRIELEDNLDDNGSYKIIFLFDERASTFFEPLRLVKHVTFDAADEEVAECTTIHWKPGQNPMEKIPDSDSTEWSIFEWFGKDVVEDRPDVGEVIRREIWHAPLSYYLGEQVYDDIEEEEDEEVEEEEVSDEEEDNSGPAKEEEEEEEE